MSASARSRCRIMSRFLRRSSGFWPLMTHGLPSVRGMRSSTHSTAGVSFTRREPVFESLSRSSRAVRSMSSHLSVRISFLRHPVSSSRRIAGITVGNTGPSASASSSTRATRWYSSWEGNRSRRYSLYHRIDRHGLRRGSVMPHASASLNIFASTSRVWLAE